MLCYVLQVSEHVEREDLKALLGREIGPEIEEAIVTAGQLLIEQGRQQGLEQGREKGRQQGREEVRQQGREEGRQRLQEVLLQLLRQRFGGQVDSNVEKRIEAASIEQVETWTRRVLSAASLGELFAN